MHHDADATACPPRRLVPIQPRPPGDTGLLLLQLRARAQDAAATSAADARRSRHRLAVKRAYHQRLNLLHALRDEAQHLEAEFQRQLETAAVESPCSEPLDPPAMAPLRSLYVRLLAVKEELERENRALLELSRQHVQFQQRLDALTCGGDDDNVEDSAKRRSNDKDGATPPSRSAQPPTVAIRPLTAVRCGDVIRETWAEVQVFMRRTDHFDLGARVFGWSHRHRFADATRRHLQYSISKTFPNVGAYELCQRGWVIMTTNRHYKELHSSSMTSGFELVQHIDKDNLVFLRRLRRSSQHPTYKTVLLASQFQVDGGYMTIYRSLDPKEVVLADASNDTDVQWLDMFSWTYFEDDPDAGGVRFVFGGEMRHGSEDNARFWLMELLLMALRWESKAIGPLFTLDAAPSSRPKTGEGASAS